MRAATFIVVFAAATGLAHAGQPTSKDLVGTWVSEKLKEQAPPYFTLRADSTYYGVEGDMILRGTWKLFDHGRKLEMWIGGGVPKRELSVPPIREVFRIDGYDQHVLRVTRPDGLKDVWRRRGKRSNQAMQRTAGRAAFPLPMTSTLNVQPQAPSPAVADLGSR